jgi:hypothetical protein
LEKWQAAADARFDSLEQGLAAVIARLEQITELLLKTVKAVVSVEESMSDLQKEVFHV